jgi:hypothetical protein
MSLFAAWVIYPLVLLALCVGVGLLVDVLCGRRLPGGVVAPTGLAAIIVVGEFTTLSSATAPFTAPAVCALAVLGAGFSLPWRFGRPEAWAVGASLAVFLVFAAPAVLSGASTFAGYIKLDDTATWLALTDRLMEHGRSLSGLGPSSYRATLEFNLAGGYPVGTFVPFGTAQKLVGGDLAWVFQPYLSFLAAMLSLCLWQIAGELVRRPPARAFVAFLAAQPALLFGYAMWGGVKEIAAATLVALAATLVPATVRPGGRRRDVLPPALVVAALLGVLSPSGIIWIGPMLVALAVVALRELRQREALARAGLFAAAVALLSVPALSSGLTPPVPSSESLLGSSAKGNLVDPLDPLQMLGVWPSGDFRFHPDATVATAVLIALAIFAAVVGGWAAWGAWRRRGGGAAILFYATALLACAAIVAIASPWAGAKALATASPIALSLAVIGAFALLRVDRPTGAALLAVLAGGVLWSNVLAYGGVSLAPYAQLRELEAIGHRFAGQGPTLMTEYNPYGARHFLRFEEGEGASELRNRQVSLRSGGTAEKGAAPDTDEIDIASLFEYPTLVLRRSPVRSRPPVPYRLVWAGRYYEVWQRPASFSGPMPDFLSLGDARTPAAVPNCPEVNGLAEVALLHHVRNPRLIAARHAPVYDATSGVLRLPRGGRYEAWLMGSVRGSVELLVDGRAIGEARQQLENEGGFIPLGVARFAAGAHTARLRFGGADLNPGSGGFPRPETGPLLVVPASRRAGELVSASIDEATRFCGRPWDWIEVVGGA